MVWLVRAQRFPECIPRWGESECVCVGQEEQADGGLLWQAVTHMALCNLSADDITVCWGDTHGPLALTLLALAKWMGGEDGV